MEYEQVALDALEPNTYNFNKIEQGAFRELVEEVRKRGVIFHHVVAERRPGAKATIIDGEHQWRAAQEAGLATVPVQWFTPASHAERVAETWRRNGLRGETNHVRLGRAIREAQARAKEEGRPSSAKALAPLFGKRDVWIGVQLAYADLADLAGSRPDLPATEDEVAKLTEKQVKEFLALRGLPMTEEGNNDDSGAAPDGETQASAEQPTEDEKHTRRVVKLKLAVVKLPAEDRAEIRKALDEADRQERAKAKAKATAQPGEVAPKKRGRKPVQGELGVDHAASS